MKHDLRSISKSVTSLLVGIALSEGKFPALDSSVFDAFPDYADLKTPEKARITFRDLLTMSAGLAWDENLPWNDPRNNEREMIMAADPFRYILSQPVAFRPARSTPTRAAARRCSARRSSGPPVVRCATTRAKTLPAHRRARFRMAGCRRQRQARRLRQPAHAAARCRQARPPAADRRPVERQAGDPGRLVSRVDQAAHQRRGLFFYGYQWWLGRSFRNGSELTWAAGVGLGGQRLYVVPSLDLVVMITAGHYRDGLQGTVPRHLQPRRAAGRQRLASRAIGRPSGCSKGGGGGGGRRRGKPPPAGSVRRNSLRAHG